MFQRIKFSFCRNQVCVSKNQICLLQKSSLRFKESSLRSAEIKFAFQRIKFAFCRNQGCVSKNQDYVSKNQVLFHRIKFHRVESSCCVVRMISIVHRTNEHIIFFIHEALGNKLSYRYIVTNPSFLNIVINPSFLKLYASALDF